MTNFAKLPTWADKQRVYAVVETPRGSRAKLEFDPKLGAFTLAKPLLAGLTYPYDWGFIPSTLGEDGDPLDGLVIHQAASAPGVVIKCDLLGALRVKQKERGGAALRNDRYILCPRKEDAEDEPVADRVPEHLRRVIEQFFRSSVSETGKEIRFKGWQDAAEARKSIKKGMKAFAART